jgi:hypothetical protein
MKEIDLLPEWYKSGRRRQISYRSQYLALGCIFAAMMVWNFITSGAISKASAQVRQHVERKTESEGTSEEFAALKNEVAVLQQKADVLEKVDSRIDIADVLAELSFLVGEKIVLGRAEIVAETIKSEKNQAKNIVRGAGDGTQDAGLLGDVRFKVVIGGVAAEAGEVAQLVCRLEESEYFCLVYPSFSRSRQIKTGLSKLKTSSVSEFEISCYLANYRQD